MNQTYRIAGWMTELESGLTVDEWRQVLDRVDSELDYLPFEISQANATIIGLIDRELVEEWDQEWGYILSEKLEPLCEDWSNESDLCEYPIYSGEVAYIGCSTETFSEDIDLTDIESFEEFAQTQGVEMTAVFTSSDDDGRFYDVTLLNHRGQELRLYDFFMGSALGEIKVEDALNHLGDDLLLYEAGEYMNLDWNEDEIKDFLMDIRRYYIFTTREEREALMRLAQ